MSAEQTVAGVVCSLMVQKRTVFVNCTEFHVSIPLTDYTLTGLIRQMSDAYC